MKKILEVGVLLSSERDIHQLLEQILSCVMELAHCDAGTLYLLDGDVLRFKIMRNDTLGTYSGGDGKDPKMDPVPMERGNVCALALLEDRTICIEDVKADTGYDFSGPARYDQKTGYDTRSMLVVPMQNRSGEKVGALQLINALDDKSKVCAFAPDMALVVESVASQAAITIQNVRYIRDIKELFHSFVQVMSAAIDERTPYNASHARHMAECGSRFIDYLGSVGDRTPLTPDQKEEFLMSILLHDIGKLVTPLEVMNKARRRLPTQTAAVAHRLETIRLLAKIHRLEGRITEAGEQEQLRQVEEARELVQKADGAGFVTDEMYKALEGLRKRYYTGEDGRPHPWLTEDEHAMLSIRKGTLSQEERRQMEEHVEVTDRLLSQIHFPGDLSHVRQWAAAHHELLNGSGYPKHLKGEEIPDAVRIITILDIFDSLVADDRPYKRAMPVEKALSILKTMAEEEGKLDPALTAHFIASRCWEG